MTYIPCIKDVKKMCKKAKGLRCCDRCPFGYNERIAGQRCALQDSNSNEPWENEWMVDKE